MSFNEELNGIQTEHIIKLIKLGCDLLEAGSKERKSFFSGGGQTGGLVCREMMLKRPPIEISQDAKDAVDASPWNIEEILLPKNKSEAKRFITATNNVKKLEDRIEQKQVCTRDHNAPNKAIIDALCEAYENGATDEELANIINDQRLDIITIHENDKLDKSNFKSKGTRLERNALCSKKFPIKEAYPEITDGVLNKFINKYL